MDSCYVSGRDCSLSKCICPFLFLFNNRVPSAPTARVLSGNWLLSRRPHFPVSLEAHVAMWSDFCKWSGSRSVQSPHHSSERKLLPPLFFSFPLAGAQMNQRQPCSLTLGGSRGRKLKQAASRVAS